MTNKSIRSSQILSPFGIGQIVNFPQEVSLMICGLSQWNGVLSQRKIQAGHDSIDEKVLKIVEPRLQALLKVDYFISPFTFNLSGTKNRKLTIPAVRFPSWHYCTNPNCGRMREVELTLADDNIECKSCASQGKAGVSKMIPVRFVAACSSGHIQDVPFKEWVHNGLVPKSNEEHCLSYHSLPGAGDLGSILIKCSCGEKRTLAGLMNVKKNGDQVLDSALARLGLDNDDYQELDNGERTNKKPNGQYCKGYRPWLGLEGVQGAKECNEHLQVLIRGGSNVHYSDIVSALYLPEASNDVDDQVLRILEGHGGKKTLRMLYEIDGGGMLRTILSKESDIVIDKLIVELLVDNRIEDKKDLKEITEGDLRFEEYNYILEGRDSENSDFKAIRKTFENYIEAEFLAEYFECVVLIEKLRETRVFRGFSRINPGKLVDMSYLSNEEVRWLPAVESYGEGIFLKFSDNKIDTWLEENGHVFLPVIDRYRQALFKRNPTLSPRNLNATFVLMHTFAHLLIKRLCFNCGYGSSSLRERIYFNNGEDRMNGILIYTSSGDSEGSLGGLIRQGKGRNLSRIVKDAIEDARWCSADPVCSDIGMSSGQGPDNVNGAACHNCCIVPETSCEEFNMLLDRGTVTGSLESNVGYFNQ